MKLPRGITGEQLVAISQRHGYEMVRQKGSHARLRHPGPPAHALTVPLHESLKIGTLAAILREVARARSSGIDELINLL